MQKDAGCSKFDVRHMSNSITVTVEGLCTAPADPSKLSSIKCMYMYNALDVVSEGYCCVQDFMERVREGETKSDHLHFVQVHSFNHGEFHASFQKEEEQSRNAKVWAGARLPLCQDARIQSLEYSVCTALIALANRSLNGEKGGISGQGRLTLTADHVRI